MPFSDRGAIIKVAKSDIRKSSFNTKRQYGKDFLIINGEVIYCCYRPGARVQSADARPYQTVLSGEKAVTVQDLNCGPMGALSRPGTRASGCQGT